MDPASIAWPGEKDLLGQLRLGFALPFDGMRVVLRTPHLRRRALVPALIFAGLFMVAAMFALHEQLEGSVLRHLYVGYAAIVAAAPVSPILFTKSYARLAASAREAAGFPVRRPYLRGYGTATWEALIQLIFLALYLAPVSGLLRPIPFVGAVILASLGFLWALHWSVVEALDAARTLPADAESDSPPERKPVYRRRPWYARAPQGPAPLRWILRPLAWWGGLINRPLVRWQGELHFMERHPWMSLGFCAGALVLLALPLINLFFRAFLVAGAALWLARAEQAEAA